MTRTSDWNLQGVLVTFYLTPTPFEILINAESMDYLLELWPILSVFIDFFDEYE